MALIKQSVAYTRTFLLVLSTDHITGATGKTPTVNLSKGGGTFGAAAGTVTEIANGWYKVALTTTDTNTLGELIFDITATACDNTDFADQVVSFDPNDSAALGLTNLNATVSSRSTYAGGAVASVTAGVTLDSSVYATIASNVWSAATSALSTAGSIGLKLANWVLGTDSKAIISADVHTCGATVAAVTSLPFKRNAAVNNFPFIMVSSVDHISPLTGATVTALRAIDGSGFAACSGTPVEVGNGVYRINLSAADLNGLAVTLLFTATGADSTIIPLITD